MHSKEQVRVLTQFSDRTQHFYKTGLAHDRNGTPIDFWSTLKQEAQVVAEKELAV